MSTLYLVLANSLPIAGRLRTLLVAVALGLGLLAGPLALPAHAEGTAQTFVVEASLDARRRLAVTQTITFTGDVPSELVQKFETREDLVGDRQYVQEHQRRHRHGRRGHRHPERLRRTGGSPPSPCRPTAPPRWSSATPSVGAVVNIPDGTALRVRLLQGLSAQVAEFTATVQIPGQFSYIKCTAGNPNSTTPCTFAAAGTEAAQVPTFGDGPRGEGQMVAVDIGFPPGTVAANEQIEYRWTVARAFSARPLPLALALGLLVLGGIGLFLLHRRTGTDASAAGEISRVGEFVPTGAGQSEFRVVGEVRPGHVGTVADERVDPIDVTATMVDLAVRGHLRITELPRDGEFALTDWELTRVSGGPNGLRPFETAAVGRDRTAGLECQGLRAAEPGERDDRRRTGRALRRGGEQRLVRPPAGRHSQPIHPARARRADRRGGHHRDPGRFHHLRPGRAGPGGPRPGPGVRRPGAAGPDREGGALCSAVSAHCARSC